MSASPHFPAPPPTSDLIPDARTSNHLIASLFEQLKCAIDEIESTTSQSTKTNNEQQVDYNIVLDLLQQHTTHFYRNIFDSPTTASTLQTRQLENEVEALKLQLEVSREQFQVMVDKNKDTIDELGDLRKIRDKLDEEIEHEFAQRSGLETERLKLLEALSSLRIENDALKRNLQQNITLDECMRSGTNNDDDDIDGEEDEDPEYISERELDAMRHELKQLQQTRQQLMSNDDLACSSTTSISNANQPGGVTVHHQQQLTAVNGNRQVNNGLKVISPDDEGVYLENEFITNTNTPSPNDQIPTNQMRQVDNDSSISSHSRSGGKKPNLTTASTAQLQGSSRKRDSHFAVPQTPNKLATISSPNLTDESAFTARRGRDAHGGSMMKLFDSFRSRKSKSKSRISQNTGSRVPRHDSTAWNCEQVCSWFTEIGFEDYIGQAKQIPLTGLNLLKAIDQPEQMLRLAKKLKLANSFHRRKLELAASELFYPTPQCNVSPGRLDNLWIIRWLDDIGLPQYKDSFAKAGIDGRMLNNLTLIELQNLGITLEIHYTSFRRGIELLRRVNFTSDYFIRRPSETGIEEKLLWSNHRVMEWLHSIDLMEYSTALRGSGLHGGLILLEPRFTANTLADLLNIPKSKKLLRKHLRIKFNDLLSKEQLEDKNKTHSKEILTHSSKFKPRKIQQMMVTSLPKSYQGDIGLTWHVCPRRINSADASTTLPRNSNNNTANEITASTTQPSLSFNNRPMSHVSTVSNGVSGKVIGGMAALDLQCN